MKRNINNFATWSHRGFKSPTMYKDFQKLFEASLRIWILYIIKHKS